MKDFPGTPCAICGEIIPPDACCIYHSLSGQSMCMSHEGHRVEVWRLTLDGGSSCIYRKKDEASEDIKEFKANRDKYRFRKVKMPAMELLAVGEFVGW